MILWILRKCNAERLLGVINKLAAVSGVRLVPLRLILNLKPYTIFSDDLRRNIKMYYEDITFLELYSSVEEVVCTPIDGCYLIYQLSRECAGLDGDFAEVGVYRGGSAVFMNFGKNLHLYDTFDGMPQGGALDWHQKGVYSETSAAEVEERVNGAFIHKGVFPESGKGEAGNQFSFVYLDADLYSSIRNSLEFFYPRIVDGGIVLIDDYLSCPGVRRAIQDFFCNKYEKPIYIPSSSGHVMIRRQRGHQ